MTQSNIQAIDERFKTGDGSAVVKREDWDGVLAEIAKDEEALSRTIDARDYWEGLATRLAESVGEHFNMDVGEHSSANCPVLRAIEILEGYRCAHEVAMEDANKSGCKCHGCSKKYRGDLLVPDDVWEKIKPEGDSAGGGLLCPTCIMNRIIDMQIWSAASAVDIESCQSDSGNCFEAVKAERDDLTKRVKMLKDRVTVVCAQRDAMCERYCAAASVGDSLVDSLDGMLSEFPDEGQAEASIESWRKRADPKFYQRVVAHIRAAGAREALERAMQETGFSGTVVRVDVMREIIEQMEGES